MPSYVVTTSHARLSPTQKQGVVDAVTLVHHEEADVPAYLVQVIFHELPPTTATNTTTTTKDHQPASSSNHHYHYINRRPVSLDQIWIRGDIRTGRTDAQKTHMVERMLESCSRAAGIDPSYLWVYLCDIPKMAEFGSVLPDPGGERDWVETLGRGVRERYGLY